MVIDFDDDDDDVVVCCVRSTLVAADGWFGVKVDCLDDAAAAEFVLWVTPVDSCV